MDPEGTGPFSGMVGSDIDNDEDCETTALA